MIEGFLHLFARRSWTEVGIDILDIWVVTYVIYRALLVVRGTRAIQMGTGLAVIFTVYLAARQIGLVTLYNMLSTLLSSFILIVVVVFQNDIRRGLMRVGSRAVLGGMSRQQESRVIDEVVAAVTELARHRIGALICFEQDANLDEFVVGQGTMLDASVQRELLVGLFVPESLNKLHDGAVVIRNFRIAKAGVFFPMPEAKLLDKSLGSRHRAALGITEETDAVVVVVSEERGTISFCVTGNIVSNLDGASLRQALLGLFGQRNTRSTTAPTKRPVRPTTGRRSMPSSASGSFRMGTDGIVRDDDEPRSSQVPSSRRPDSGLERALAAVRESESGIESKRGDSAPPSVRITPAPASRVPTSTHDTPMPHSVPPPPRGPSEK